MLDIRVFSKASQCSTYPAATRLQVIILVPEHDDLGGSCSGLGLEAQKLRKSSTAPSSRAQMRNNPQRLSMVNDHSISAYCNARPPE
ncbi:hypothetical protein A2U01_0044348 [Trifolium medium]|uniref:Uncharacterized protein n=1 Tax=Trifolium medium TaxID=97028 RepID=A0A392QHF9_9FABA|nr:hypothetical protein [Trifolium medium]